MFNSREILAGLAIKAKGDWASEYRYLKSKVMCEDQYVYLGNKMKYITLIDEDFPECLKDVTKVPIVLFYKGNIRLLESEKRVSVVGTRDMTQYGKEVCNKLIDDFYDSDRRDDVVFISGMAKGIDGEVSRAVIRNKGKLISVLGSGIDRCYPDESKDIYDYCCSENGLIVSEYPFDEAPQKEHFPFRNRILVGLGKILLVIEGKEKSGTNISVKEALDQGKDILSVPCPITSRNNLTNKLIADGAVPCLSYIDISERLY